MIYVLPGAIFYTWFCRAPASKCICPPRAQTPEAILWAWALVFACHLYLALPSAA